MNAHAAWLLLLVAIVTTGAGKPQTLPAGTEVKRSFAQSLSSDHAVQGERVELRVAEDVRSGETVVVRAGARVLGTTPRAQSAEAPRMTGTGFSIASPPGSGWTTKKSEMGFTFERKREGPAPCKTTHTYLLAERNLAKGDAASMSEEQVAEDFRDTEEAGMMVKGVIQGMYDLIDLQRGVITRGEKTLYYMKYRTVGPPMRRKSDSRSASDAVLYLYFSPGFATDRFFYMFLENASCVTKKGDGPPQRTDDILPIIDSLRIESSPR